MPELNKLELEQEVLEVQQEVQGVQQGVQEVAHEVQDVQQEVQEVEEEVLEEQQGVQEVAQEVQEVAQEVQDVQQGVPEVEKEVQQEVPQIEPRVMVSLGPTKEQPGPRKVKMVNGKTLLRDQSYTLVSYTRHVPNFHQNVHLQSFHAGMLPPGDPTFLCLSHPQPHTAGGCHLLKRQEINVPPYSTFRYSGHITCCLQFH